MNEAIHNKRNHGIIIFDNTIRTLSGFIIPFAVTLLPALKSGMADGLMLTLFIYAAFMGLGIIYAIGDWFFRTYSIEDGMISTKHGVFIKKDREIPIISIVTVHELQTLSQRLFDVWTLKLDTGSSLLKDAEIKLVVSRQDLNKIKKLLGKTYEKANETENEIRPGKVYQAQASSLIKMGLTSNAVFAGLALILSTLQLFSEIFESQLDDLSGLAENVLNSSPLNISPEFFLFFFLAIFIYCILSLFIASAASLVKYHNFSVVNEGGSLVIKYGLLKKNIFAIPEKKITAIYYKQSFLRQLLGLASVSIESTGYGNEKGEESLLIPLARLSEINGILTGIVSDYRSPADIDSVPRRSLSRFIIGAAIYPLILIIPISIFYPYGFLSLFLIPVILLNAVMQFRNSGISWSSNKLFIRYGGFSRSFVEISREGVQAVIKKATPFQRAAKLFTLNISIHGSAFGKILTVKHLDAGLFLKIRDLF